MEGRGRQELPEGEREQTQPWKVLYITLVGARSLACILLAMCLARLLQGLCLEVIRGGYAGGAYKNMEPITHRQDSNYRGLGCWVGVGTAQRPPPQLPFMGLGLGPNTALENPGLVQQG